MGCCNFDGKAVVERLLWKGCCRKAVVERLLWKGCCGKAFVVSEWGIRHGGIKTITQTTWQRLGASALLPMQHGPLAEPRCNTANVATSADSIIHCYPSQLYTNTRNNRATSPPCFSTELPVRTQLCYYDEHVSGISVGLQKYLIITNMLTARFRTELGACTQLTAVI